MLTKRDLQSIGSLMDVKFEPMKKDIKHMKSNVDSINQKLDELVNAIGAIFAWTDDIHRAIIGKPAKRPHEN